MIRLAGLTGLAMTADGTKKDQHLFDTAEAYKPAWRHIIVFIELAIELLLQSHVRIHGFVMAKFMFWQHPDRSEWGYPPAWLAWQHKTAFWVLG